MQEANKIRAEVPPRPTKPDPNECCGSGCTPCVFDYYYAALEKWNKKYDSAVHGADIDAVS